MTTQPTPITPNSAVQPATEAAIAWKRSDDETSIECRVLLCPEESGGYSIHALDLPGVVSQGENENEAVKNIIDAFREAIAAYRDSKSPIPWSKVIVDDAPKGSKELRIVVDA